MLKIICKHIAATDLGTFRPTQHRLAITIGLAAHLAACGPANDVAAATAVESVSSVESPVVSTIGAHALVYQRLGEGLNTIQTPALTTATVGSTLLVSVGRGQIGAFERPTDNKNASPYVQIGSVHAYTHFARSGTGLYALVGALGGNEHVVSTNTPSTDELTMAVVEVLGGQIDDAAWNEVVVGQSFWRKMLFSKSSTTSASVTSSGPATLVAFWWGDADVEHDKTAVPDGGFTVIDSILESGALVQCAVAVKHVDAAGTYNVTWTATPLQGAQMWLVAIADQTAVK